MTPEKLNRQIRIELHRLVEAKIITYPQMREIAERYPVGRWDLVTLTRWFSILGVVAIGSGLFLLAKKFATAQTLVQLGLVLTCIAAGVLGWTLERKRNFPRAGSALQLLSAMAFQAFTFVLAKQYSTGSGNWPTLVGLNCAIFAIVAYLTSNRSILVYALINLFVWFGGSTGYISGWGVYWLGMTYPLRFIGLSAVILLIAYSHYHRTETRYQSFSRAYAHFGLLTMNLALWFFSIFGYFENFNFGSTSIAERLSFTVLWFVVSVGCLFASSQTGLRLLRSYGITFIFINAYTSYFQFVFARSASAWILHLFVIGLSFFGLAGYYEHKLREKSQASTAVRQRNQQED